MRILLINIFHYRKGGSETVYFNTAELLRSHGNEVRFFSFADDLMDKDENDGVFCEAPRGAGRVTSYFYNRKAADALDKMLSEWTPDIAHVHLIWGRMSPSIIDVLHRHNVPVVHTAHDYRMVCPAYVFRNGKGEICEKCSSGKYLGCALHRCSKNKLAQSIMMTAEMYYRHGKHNPADCLDGIIFVSKFSEMKHLEHDAGFRDTPRKVIYNFTAPARKPSSLEEKNDHILFVGRISREKGPETLLEAASAHPDWHIDIVGSGPDEQMLRQKYASSANIVFHGYQKGDRLKDMISQARFVCVPSVCYENNPMSIIESYSLGTPVMAARIGGIPEIVEDGGTGFLFESGDPDSLERTLSKALALDDGTYRGLCERAFDFFTDHFSEDSHYQALMSFYREVIGSGRRTGRNILLADCPAEGLKNFVEACSETSGLDFKVRSEVTNHLHGSIWKTLKRYFLYFHVAFKAFLKRKSFDNVIAWQQFHGIILAFFLRLFHCRKRFTLTVLTFIYKEKKGLVGKVFSWFVKYGVTSKYIDRIVVFSKAEAERYKELFGVDKFTFTLLGCDFPEMAGASSGPGYIFATGRSNRDYDFLGSVISGSGYKAVVACNEYDHIPQEGMTVLDNCFGDEMTKKMSESFCVAIPLKSADISSGQLVAIQAMSLGKPVIATAGSALGDYIENGVSGLLVDNIRQEWLNALDALYSDPDLHRRMSDKAKSFYNSHLRLSSFGHRVGILLKENQD